MYRNIPQGILLVYRLFGHVSSDTTWRGLQLDYSQQKQCNGRCFHELQQTQITFKRNKKELETETRNRETDNRQIDRQRQQETTKQQKGNEAQAERFKGQHNKPTFQHISVGTLRIIRKSRNANTHQHLTSRSINKHGWYNTSLSNLPTSETTSQHLPVDDLPTRM